MSPVTVIHVKMMETVNRMNQETMDSNVNAQSLFMERNVKDGVKYHTSNKSNVASYNFDMHSYIC